MECVGGAAAEGGGGGWGREMGVRSHSTLRKLLPSAGNGGLGVELEFPPPIVMFPQAFRAELC